jgi:hypothetical protein
VASHGTHSAVESINLAAKEETFLFCSGWGLFPLPPTTATWKQHIRTSVPRLYRAADVKRKLNLALEPTRETVTLIEE